MDIKKEVIAVILSQFETQEEKEIFTAGLELDEIEINMNSIKFIKCVIELESLFNITFSDEDLYASKFRTVNSICQYIEERIAN